MPWLASVRAPCRDAQHSAPRSTKNRDTMRDPTTKIHQEPRPRDPLPHLSRSRPRFGCSAAAAGGSPLTALPIPTSPRPSPWCSVDVLLRASSQYVSAAAVTSRAPNAERECSPLLLPKKSPRNNIHSSLKPRWKRRADSSRREDYERLATRTTLPRGFSVLFIRHRYSVQHCFSFPSDLPEPVTQQTLSQTQAGDAGCGSQNSHGETF